MKQLSVGAQDDLRAAVKSRLMVATADDGRPGAGAGLDQDEVVAQQQQQGLGEGVLEKNIGVPLVVVGCKADSLQSETFEQQQRLHFIQQSLRRFCLKCETMRKTSGVGGGE